VQLQHGSGVRFDWSRLRGSRDADHMQSRRSGLLLRDVDFDVYERRLQRRRRIRGVLHK
jgi:hypothetical protein